MEGLEKVLKARLKEGRVIGGVKRRGTRGIELRKDRVFKARHDAGVSGISVKGLGLRLIFHHCAAPAGCC